MTTGGSYLIVGSRVSNKANDKQELVASVETVDPRVGTPTHVLTDNGYASEREVEELSSRGMDVLVAVRSGDRRSRRDFRPDGAPKPEREIKNPWMKDMDEKMKLPENKALLYRLLQQTVESMFGVMKHAMGFRRFQLREKEKAAIERDLLALAYNCKRLHSMMQA